MPPPPSQISIHVVQIMDVFLVEVAANTALTQQANGEMKTKNLQTEILISLSPHGNVSLSFPFPHEPGMN